MRQAVLNLGSQPQDNMFANSGCTNYYGLSAWTGNNGNLGTTNLVASTWSASGSAFRVDWTARINNSGDIGLQFNGTGLWSDWNQRIVGQKITCSFWVRYSHTTTESITVSNVSPGGSITSIGNSGNQAFPAGVAKQVWTTFIVNPGTTFITSIRSSAVGLPISNTGVWAETSNVDVYYGDFDPNRTINSGDLPSWRWAGSAWNSESFGYPYTLQSIAGPLLFDMSAPGTITLDSTKDIKATGVSIFTVFDVLSNPLSSVSSAFNYGQAALNDVIPNSTLGIRLNGSPAADANVTTLTRRTGGAGPYGSFSTSPMGKRIIVAGGIERNNGRVFHARSDLAAISYDDSSTGLMTAVSNDKASFPNVDPYINPVRFIGVQTDDQTTIKKVMAYLARQHKAVIPGGF